MANPENFVEQNSKTWHPARFTKEGYDSDIDAPVIDYSLLVLNVPIENRDVFQSVWIGASWRACADGGANRVKDLPLNENEPDLCRVDLICGDFDSVSPEVLEHYKGQGTEILEDRDQDSTDLMKTLTRLSEIHHRRRPYESIDIAILGGLEGRADQALSQLHQLYLSSETKPAGTGDIYLVTSTSVIFLLERGRNRIYTPVGSGFFSKYAGIVPLAGPATLTTKGFEWDLNGQKLGFGKFISTSNHIMKDVVEVETSEPIIFTLELA